MTTALILGTLLALASLAYVLQPLFMPPAPRRPVQRAPRTAVHEGEHAVSALREIEFDRVTGKLSDTDYALLKARYTGEALAAMRRDEAASPAADDDDPVEVALRRYRQSSSLRECIDCGPRPEADAAFCSGCGRFLAGRCGACGSPADTPGARFCRDCGNPLAG
jgi:hypothetical protein